MNSESIFVSYSRGDLSFAMKLTEELKKMGASIWIDQQGIKLGENWDNSIEEAIEASNILLLIISKTSAASKNVQDEVSWARKKEKKIVSLLIEECELPMRWDRLQYADFIRTPEKALTKVLNMLNLNEKTTEDVKKLLKSLASVNNKIIEGINKTENNSPENQFKSEDLLISEEEIERASKMHKKAIKKNWMLIGFVGLLSILSFIVLITVFKESQVLWISVTGCLLINLLSVKPYGSIIRREKNMELMDLFKLKRDRLTRIINKLADEEIEKFNIEFNNYISA